VDMDISQDINEPQPCIKDLWIQWQKASDELNLDDFMNTDTGKQDSEERCAL